MRYQRLHFLTLIFDPSMSSKITPDGVSRKPVAPTTKSSQASTSYLLPFSRYFESKFWLFTFWPWSDSDSPLGQRSPKEEMTYSALRSTILQNFGPIAPTVYDIMRYENFSVFDSVGLTPGPKFTKRGEDLVDSDVYHPAKFHRSKSTHARDIRYRTKNKKTKNKQTVKKFCNAYLVDRLRDRAEILQGSDTRVHTQKTRWVFWVNPP